MDNLLNMPKVSIIIPTYNRAKLLSEAIESALSQTYQDFEIIVIDDGSMDNTNEMIELYIKKHPQKVNYFYQVNKGLSSARNSGIRKARGEYIAFLDSDDRWLPNKLEIQMKIIDEEKVDFVYSYAYVEIDGRMSTQFKPSAPALNFYDLFVKGKSLVISTVVIKRDYIEKAGMFDETLRVAEDCDLWIRVLLCYKVKFIDTPLIIYRVHNSNLSSDMEIINKAGIKICLKLLKSNAVPKNIVNRKLAYKYYMLGKVYYKEKRYREAGIQIKNAIMAFPLVGTHFISPNEQIKTKIIKLIKPYFVLIFLSLLIFRQEIKNAKI